MTAGVSFGRRVTNHARYRWQVADRHVKATRYQIRGLRRLDADFLVIGVMKGGTTSLYDYLCKHPAVGRSTEKETWFFNDNDRYRRGVSWYRGHFPVRTAADDVLRQYGVHPMVGEATPHYLINPIVPERVKQYNPRMKLIALLRDPVARAYSHYQHQFQMGLEWLSFEDALAQEPNRLEGELERMLRDPLYESEPRRRKSYLLSGLYLDHLTIWLETFPRDQLLVLRSEDLYARPAETTAQAIEFLDLPPVELTGFSALNTLSYDSMQPETREFLRDYYAEPNQCLSDFLECDLGWL